MKKTWIIGLPAYAKNHHLVVAKHYDDEWWFWGAYDSYAETDFANGFNCLKIFKTEEITGEWE